MTADQDIFNIEMRVLIELNAHSYFLQEFLDYSCKVSPLNSKSPITFSLDKGAYIYIIIIKSQILPISDNCLRKKKLDLFVQTFFLPHNFYTETASSMEISVLGKSSSATKAIHI